MCSRYVYQVNYSDIGNHTSVNGSGKVWGYESSVLGGTYEAIMLRKAVQYVPII